MTASCPPLLILAFNRPDTTRRVLESVRVARPARVYFAVDGPRADREGEAAAVQAVRELAGTLAPDIELHTLFQEKNLGCKLAVSQAIGWFFSDVEAGIILEDDCIAHPSFFPFAAELLARYRDDERVSMVSGNNFQRGRRRTEDSYYFSRYVHIWGWATWRRAWRLYDHGMARWPQLRAEGWLSDVLGDPVAVKYWTQVFDETHAERNTSWAYRWMFASWVHSRLVALPAVNLVSNIGFGEHATHTLNRESPFAAMRTDAMRFPLQHPASVMRDARADAFTQGTVYASVPPLWRRVARRAARLFGREAGG
ncbi:MAG TPA: glycosyltransferase family A protein [Burkholderiales bacterium]|nr:glycosyltransferase family A protein [Burkholderiales bacterium]